MSTQYLPLQFDDRKPLGPRTTCSTSFGPNTIVTTTSARASTSAGLLPAVTPGSIWRSTASGRMSWTTISKPARRTFRAALLPMVPSPMNPTIMQCLPEWAMLGP